VKPFILVLIGLFEVTSALILKTYFDVCKDGFWLYGIHSDKSTTYIDFVSRSDEL